MTVKYFGMVMRINIDCNGCCRKVKRALLQIPELETHVIEQRQSRVIVCGRFIPQDVVIKIKKKTNRRVEILEIQDLSDNDAKNEEQQQKPIHNNTWTLMAAPNQVETYFA